MGKKHPYYGKSMSISFPDFPHTMGFVAFSRTVGNLWGNPCISHMMTSVNFFLWYLVFCQCKQVSMINLDLSGVNLIFNMDFNKFCNYHSKSL